MASITTYARSTADEGDSLGSTATATLTSAPDAPPSFLERDKAEPGQRETLPSSSDRSNLQLYLQEIGKTALLTPAEEVTPVLLCMSAWISKFVSLWMTPEMERELMCVHLEMVFSALMLEFCMLRFAMKLKPAATGYDKPGNTNTSVVLATAIAISDMGK